MLSLWQVSKVDHAGFKPLAPRLKSRNLALDLVVFDDLASFSVDNKHLARL